MIVVDANVLSFYLIQGERTAAAYALQAKDPEWSVPTFWSIEFLSILRKYIRFNGMPLAAALNLLDQAQTLLAANEAQPPLDIVLRDALRWGITVYDAQYVSLAKLYGIPCVTEDGRVLQRCPDVAISLADFLKAPPAGEFIREPPARYRPRRPR